jgi:acetyl/propionyl-CoA carboxylase alpha subunit
MFSKILIANRGEIAVRIIKTRRRMGAQSVQVCAEVECKDRFQGNSWVTRGNGPL